MFKLFEMTEGGQDGLCAFVKKYTGTAPKPGQISYRSGAWRYKNPKLDVMIELDDSETDSELILSKLGVR